jgi:ElaB/YqjD/DUF883 family membrane-anchored ribosome-binding protein
MSNPERSARAARPANRGASDDITAIGLAAFRDARAGAENAMADAGDKGREALRSAREVRDTFADALLESLESHPYTTLALVAGAGFLLGAIWRR